MTSFLKHTIFLFVIVAAVIAGAACSSSECLDNKNSLPLAGFYSSADKPQAISLDSISIFGIGAPGDSILHDSVRSLSSSYLPFRIDQGETSYRIEYLAGEAGKRRMADRITFKYDIEPWFVSSACGVIYRYRIKDIEHTNVFIDSVTCPGGVITNVSGENIKIYFRVNVVDEEGGAR